MAEGLRAKENDPSIIYDYIVRVDPHILLLMNIAIHVSTTIIPTYTLCNVYALQQHKVLRVTIHKIIDNQESKTIKY